MVYRVVLDTLFLRVVSTCIYELHKVLGYIAVMMLGVVSRYFGNGRDEHVC
jgi:hypothetical protein